MRQIRRGQDDTHLDRQGRKPYKRNGSDQESLRDGSAGHEQKIKAYGVRRSKVWKRPWQQRLSHTAIQKADRKRRPSDGYASRYNKVLHDHTRSRLARAQCRRNGKRRRDLRA